MTKRRIHEDEYMSSDIWKYNVDEPEYKRGSRHNKIGMIIMWSFYGIVIAQLIHVITVIPFFPITFMMLLFGAYILFQGWIAR